MHGGNGEVLSKASQYGTGRGRESPERGLFAEMVDAVFARGLARRPDRATPDPAGQMVMLCVHAAIPTLLAVREPEPFRADA